MEKRERPTRSPRRALLVAATAGVIGLIAPVARADEAIAVSGRTSDGRPFRGRARITGRDAVATLSIDDEPHTLRAGVPVGAKLRGVEIIADERDTDGARSELRRLFDEEPDDEKAKPRYRLRPIFEQEPPRSNEETPDEASPESRSPGFEKLLDEMAGAEPEGPLPTVKFYGMPILFPGQTTNRTKDPTDVSVRLEPPPGEELSIDFDDVVISEEGPRILAECRLVLSEGRPQDDGSLLQRLCLSVRDDALVDSSGQRRDQVRTRIVARTKGGRLLGEELLVVQPVAIEILSHQTKVFAASNGALWVYFELSAGEGLRASDLQIERITGRLTREGVEARDPIVFEGFLDERQLLQRGAQGVVFFPASKLSQIEPPPTTEDETVLRFRVSRLSVSIELEGSIGDRPIRAISNAKPLTSFWTKQMPVADFGEPSSGHLDYGSDGAAVLTSVTNTGRAATVPATTPAKPGSPEHGAIERFVQRSGTNVQQSRKGLDVRLGVRADDQVAGDTSEEHNAKLRIDTFGHLLRAAFGTSYAYVPRTGKKWAEFIAFEKRLGNGLPANVTIDVRPTFDYESDIAKLFEKLPLDEAALKLALSATYRVLDAVILRSAPKINGYILAAYLVVSFTQLALELKTLVEDIAREGIASPEFDDEVFPRSYNGAAGFVDFHATLPGGSSEILGSQPLKRIQFPPLDAKEPFDSGHPRTTRTAEPFVQSRTLIDGSVYVYVVHTSASVHGATHDPSYASRLEPPAHVRLGIDLGDRLEWRVDWKSLGEESDR